MTSIGTFLTATLLEMTRKNWLSRRDNRYLMPVPPWSVLADMYGELCDKLLLLLASTTFGWGHWNTICFSRNEIKASGNFDISSDDGVGLIWELIYFNAYIISPPSDILAPLQNIKNFDKQLKYFKETNMIWLLRRRLRK